MSTEGVTSGEAVPRSMRYSETVPKSIKSSINYSSFLANNGSIFQEGGIVRIPITSSNQFLDTKQSFLRFEVNVQTTTAGGTVYFDGGGAGLIQRIRVLTAQNVELTRTDGYNLLNVALMDMNSNLSYSKNFARVGEGLGNVNYTSSNNPQTSLTDVNNYSNVFTSPANVTTTAASTDSSLVSFSIPLHCDAVLGPTMKKLLPLPIINGGIVLELLLAPAKQALYTAGIGTAVVSSYKMQNITFVGAMVMIDDTKLSQLIQIVRAGGLLISTQAWRQYLFTPSYGSQQVMKITDSLRSVKSYLGFFINRNTFGNGNISSLSSRSRCGLSQYYMKYNNVPIPSEPIVCGTNDVIDGATNTNTGYSKLYVDRAYAHLLNAMGRLSDVSHGLRLDLNRYSLISAGRSDNFTSADYTFTKEGSFMFGGNLDAFQSAVLSGINMSQNNLSQLELYITLPSSTIASGNIEANLYVYLLYDQELVIDQNFNLSVIN